MDAHVHYMPTQCLYPPYATDEAQPTRYTTGAGPSIAPYLPDIRTLLRKAALTNTTHANAARQRITRAPLLFDHAPYSQQPRLELRGGDVAAVVEAVFGGDGGGGVWQVCCCCFMMVVVVARVCVYTCVCVYMCVYKPHAPTHTYINQ